MKDRIVMNLTLFPIKKQDSTRWTATMCLPTNKDKFLFNELKNKGNGLPKDVSFFFFWRSEEETLLKATDAFGKPLKYLFAGELLSIKSWGENSFTKLLLNSYPPTTPVVLYWG